MIDGEQRGPFELDRLAEVGVRPSTYVWAKDMDDWEKAEDVPDICRMFRQRIHNLMHPSSVEAERRNALPAPQEQPDPSKFNGIQRFQGVDLPSVDEIENNRDTVAPPKNMIALAVISTVFFFPITGAVAILLAMKSRATWKEAEIKSNANSADPFTKKVEADSGLSASDLRKLAHEYCQGAKMWTGISFFLGLILYAFFFHIF